MDTLPDNPLVSIIVRTKDRPKLLKNALRSIAAQSYRPREVVLVNDGGCDLDIEEIKGILGDISLNYIRLEQNTGRAHAGNVGVENAKGKYVGFLDDDDEFYPEHIETLITFLEQSDYKVAYTDSLMVYKEHNPDTHELSEREKELIFSKDFDYDYLVFENYIPFMCLLFNREVLNSSGGFDSNFDLCEDWELLIRIGDRYPFYHINKVTADYSQWSSELQISLSRDQNFLEQSYLKVLSKHNAKITLNRIHRYVSGYINTRYLLKEVKNEFEKYKIHLKEENTFISYFEAKLGEKEQHIATLENALKGKDQHIASLENALKEKEAYINFIHSGHGWKLLTRYFKIRDRLLPVGTKRRHFVKLFFKTITEPKEALKELKENIKNPFSKKSILAPFKKEHFYPVIQKENSTKLLKAFSHLTDKQWLEVLIESIERPVVNGIELPGFPPEEYQRESVGSSGEKTLREAYNFYCEIKHYAEKLGHKLTQERSILDFGCGWGRIIRFFLKDVISDNLYGIDVDPEMIEFCRRLVGYGKYSVVSPLPPTDFSDESIDIVYAYSVFSHLSEPVHIKWIEEFSRILKPGGILIATTEARYFIEYCRSLRGKRRYETSWHESLASTFPDTEATLKDYDRGNFVFSPTGGGQARPSSFYGEAVIPRAYVEREWTKYLEFRDFVDDQNRMWQAMIVMQKATQAGRNP